MSVLIILALRSCRTCDVESDCHVNLVIWHVCRATNRHWSRPNGWPTARQSVACIARRFSRCSIGVSSHVDTRHFQSCFSLFVGVTQPCMHIVDFFRFLIYYGTISCLDETHSLPEHSRHHCRACGRVLCAACASFTAHVIERAPPSQPTAQTASDSQSASGSSDAASANANVSGARRESGRLASQTVSGRHHSSISISSSSASASSSSSSVPLVSSSSSSAIIQGGTSVRVCQPCAVRGGADLTQRIAMAQMPCVIA